MKKVPFCILLTIELLVGLIAMGLLLSNIGAFSYLVAGVVFAAALTPFFLKLKKTEEEAQKAKIRRNMFLVMLLPIAAAMVAVIVVVVSLFSYFG